MIISEDHRQIPLVAECDVVIVGGGIAGVAAALSSARAGAKTLLLERQFTLGGLATLGLVTLYLPLCDGMGQQVSFGLAEELLRLSVALDEIPPASLNWRNTPHPYKKQPRFEVSYNPAVMAISCEKLLLENRVNLLYGVQLCDCIVQDGNITTLLCQSIEGRIAIRAKSYVDASGDAILCHCAGEATAEYQRQNILAAWYYTSSDTTGYERHMLGVADLPDEFRTAPALNQKRYRCLTSQDQTEFVIDAHAALLKDFLNSGRLSKQHQLSTIPTIPQVRMTRRLAGSYSLPEAKSNVHYNDSIGMIGNWKCPGPIYEIPFSCLHGNQIHNLITAGRCISTDETMWDNTRVIPACAVTGEAAGLAAAMCDDMRTLHVPSLQKNLSDRGILLHHTQLTVGTWQSQVRKE